MIRLLLALAASGCAATMAEPVRPLSARFEAELVGGTACHGEGGAWILCSSGTITVSPVYPESGRYLVRARVWQDAAGQEDAAMSMTTADQSFGPFSVSARDDEPQIVEQVIHAQRGVGIVRLAFLNDHYVPAAGEDRNLRVDWIEIHGPLDPP